MHSFSVFFFGMSLFFFFFFFFAISSSPGERLSLVWAILSPDPPFASITIILPRRATSARLVIFQHGHSLPLSNSFSPDELQALVWAIPFIKTHHLSLSYIPNQPRRVLVARLGFLFTGFPLSFPNHLIQSRRALVARLGCLSLDLSSDPDELQALVWLHFRHGLFPPRFHLSLNLIQPRRASSTRLGYSFH